MVQMSVGVLDPIQPGRLIDRHRPRPLHRLAGPAWPAAAKRAR